MHTLKEHQNSFEFKQAVFSEQWKWYKNLQKIWLNEQNEGRERHQSSPSSFRDCEFDGHNGDAHSFHG